MLLYKLIQHWIPKDIVHIIDQYYNIDYYEYDDGNVLYIYKNTLDVQYNFTYRTLIECILKHANIKFCACNKTDTLCRVFCSMCRQNIQTVTDSHIIIHNNVICNNIECFVNYCDYADIKYRSKFVYPSNLSVHKLQIYNITPPLELQLALNSNYKSITKSHTVYKDNSIKVYGYINIKHRPIIDKYYPLRHELTVIKCSCMHTDVIIYSACMIHGIDQLLFDYNCCVYVGDHCPEIITTIKITRYQNDFEIHVTKSGLYKNTYYLYFSMT